MQRSIRRRARAALRVACGSLLFAPAPPAGAHSGHEAVQVIVEGIEPAVGGVSVHAVAGAYGKLAMTTSGSTRAVLLGRAGQPILRIGPGGVEANRTAPEWYQHNEPLGIAQVPPTATQAARARWVRVSGLRSWEWFDHRLHPDGASADEWTVPLIVDGVEATVSGRLEAGTTALELRMAEDVPVPGVEILALSPTLSLSARNNRETPIDVLGADGELFARFSRTGVKANARSPVWLPTAQYGNRDLLASVIDPEAKSKLIDASPAPRFVWPDPRLLPPAGRPVTGRPGTVLARWSIPVRVRPGARPVNVEGTTVIASSGDGAPDEPASTPAKSGDGGGSRTLIALLAAATVLALGGLLAMGRRSTR